MPKSILDLIGSVGRKKAQSIIPEQATGLPFRYRRELVDYVLKTVRKEGPENWPLLRIMLLGEGMDLAKMVCQRAHHKLYEPYMDFFLQVQRDCGLLPSEKFFDRITETGKHIELMNVWQQILGSALPPAFTEWDELERLRYFWDMLPDYYSMDSWDEKLVYVKPRIIRKLNLLTAIDDRSFLEYPRGTLAQEPPAGKFKGYFCRGKVHYDLFDGCITLPAVAWYISKWSWNRHRYRRAKQAPAVLRYQFPPSADKPRSHIFSFCFVQTELGWQMVKVKPREIKFVNYTTDY